MLSKCANPSCLARFRYLHEGRIFNVETGIASSDKGIPTHRIEHFWLCEGCAQTLTIVMENEVVTTRPLRLQLAESAPQEKPAKTRDVA